MILLAVARPDFVARLSLTLWSAKRAESVDGMDESSGLHEVFLNPPIRALLCTVGRSGEERDVPASATVCRRRPGALALLCGMSDRRVHEGRAEANRAATRPKSAGALAVHSSVESAPASERASTAGR